VSWDGGISKWSGLLDIAIDGGFVVKPNQGWYAKVDIETGEVEDKKYRIKDTNTKDFWMPIVTSKKFNDYIEKRYQVSHGSIIQEDEIEEFVNDSEE
jgi:hypothetical protein